MLVHVKSLLLFGFVVNVLLHQLYKTFSPGNGRFARLMQSVQQGNVKPPVDLRYLKKEEGKQTARSPHLDSVLSFLEGIYIAVAEHRPDVRDVLPGVGTEADEGDPHGHDLDDQSKAPKAKRMKRGVKIADGRTVQDGCQQRWLPPGSMKEYWVQYRQQGGDNLLPFQRSGVLGLLITASCASGQATSTHSVTCRKVGKLRVRRLFSTTAC